MPSALQRFWEKLYVSDSGCWLWLAAKNEHGYGVFRAGGRQWKAHRWAYVHILGKDAEGMDMDHLCRRRGCVNPSHLEAVPHRENCVRGDGWSGVNARKTHCPAGHEYDDANAYVDKKGQRHCRTCRRRRMRAYREV